MYNIEFSDEQQQAVLGYFAERDIAIDLPFLQGFLFATCVDPNGIEVEQWLKTLTKDDQALDEAIAVALMALHHEISEQVYESGFQLPWHATSPLQQKHSWCEGFLMAATPFYQQLMASPLNDELKQALQVSTEQLGLFSLDEAQLQAYCAQVKQPLAEFIQEQSELAAEFAPAYAELVEVAAVNSGLFEG